MQTEFPKFTYTLKQPGVAYATLSMNGNKVEFDLTNISNPLGDMLEGLVGMIITPSHIWSEDNVCHVIWYSESSSYNWHIRRIDDKMCEVQITESVDFFGDDTETEQLLFSCPFLQLIHCFVSELDHFMKKSGLLNYSQQWQKDDFPVTPFLFLKKTLIDNGLWKNNTNAGKNILADEIKLLLL